MTHYRIEFPGTTFPPVELPDLTNLAQSLTVQNSPVLFGCRSGLCGTCLVEIEPITPESLEPPNAEEVEMLEIYAPGNPKARLACQVLLSAPIKLRKIQAS